MMKNLKLLTILFLFQSTFTHSAYPQSRNPFIGTWEGSYSCYPQGEKGITVEVKDSGRGQLIVTSYTYPLPSNPDLPMAIIEADGIISSNKLHLKNPRWIKKYRWAYLGEAAPIEYIKDKDYLYYKVCGNPVMLCRKPTTYSENQKNNFEKVPSYYDRASLSLIFLDFNDGNINNIRSAIDNISLPQKFDYNFLNKSFIRPTFRRPSNKFDIQEELFKELNKNEIGKKIVANWYNRKPNGIMDMNTIHSRGRFTATDQAFIFSQTLIRKEAALKDYGERLINLSYILVVDFQNVSKNQNSSGANVGWQADVVGYIFRINYSDNAKEKLYQSWIYNDDDQNTKSQKNRIFDNMSIPVTFVDKFVVEKVQDKKQLNQSTDINSIVEIAIRELLTRSERMIGDFKVKSPIYSTKPIRSKIGKKEGIKTDDRFFVYEHSTIPKSEILNIKRVGVVRATSKIANNWHDATGDMETTTFYQVGGYRLKSGQILQQNNDIGFETSFLKGYGEMSGFNVRFDYRISNVIKIKSSFVVLELGFQTKNYDNVTSLLGYNNSKFRFFQLEQGFAKGFQLHRNFEIRPYVNYGFEFTGNKELPDDYNIGAIYLKPGLNANINLSHNFQAIMGFCNYYSLGWFLDKDDKEILPWEDLFEGRKGKTITVGFKIML